MLAIANRWRNPPKDLSRVDLCQRSDPEPSAWWVARVGPCSPSTLRRRLRHFPARHSPLTAGRPRPGAPHDISDEPTPDTSGPRSPHGPRGHESLLGTRPTAVWRAVEVVTARAPRPN